MSEFNDDELLFAEEDETEVKHTSDKSWRILIVDDEADVHKVTKLVLSDMEFSGRKVEFVSAYSEKEARELLKDDDTISVVLLDVVMESEDSGLKLIRYIREELKNNLIRIILRTGQPGQAPEQDVILQYDINDYKSKTELTTEKLFSSIITGIRSFRDLVTIEKNKKGLEKIIDSSANIFEVQSLQNFVSGILTQLVSILHYRNDAFYCQISGFTATNSNGSAHVLAATGKYQNIDEDDDLSHIVSAEIYSLIEQAFMQKKNVFDSNHYVAYFKSQNDNENIIYLERDETIEDWERDMIDIFCSNVSIAFDNIYLKQELENLVDERTHQLKLANEELNIKNITMERELAMAKSVQQAIIPKKFTDSPHFTVAGQYFPMQNLGGDYYDVFPFSERKIAFTIVDVSGHGISAALITTMAKMSFASLAREYNPPFFILDQMNQSIYSSIGTSGMFLTAFYGIIDLDTGKMIYSSGGHNSVLIHRANGAIDAFNSLNTIVGLFPEEEYISSDTDIAPGDMIICYTDGIIEAKDANGTFFGIDQLKDIITDNTDKSPQALSSFIVERVREHIGSDKEPDDDLSILIIAVN